MFQRITKSLALIGALAMLAWMTPVEAAVSLLGGWSANSHPKEAGSDRALVLFLSAELSPSVASATAVTFGGQAMTKVTDVAFGSSYLSCWVLGETGVAAATDGNFAVTWTDELMVAEDYYASAFFGGVNQTDLTGDIVYASSGSSNATTVTAGTVSSPSGDMIAMAAVKAGGDVSFTMNNAFSLGCNAYGYMSSGHKASTGADETPSATASVAGRLGSMGVVLSGSAGGGGSSHTIKIVKNAGGDNVFVDKFEYFNGSSWVAVDATDASITYSGTWTAKSCTNSKGSTSAGAYAQLPFTGTGIRWYSTGAGWEMVDVYVDNVLQSGGLEGPETGCNSLGYEKTTGL